MPSRIYVDCNATTPADAEHCRKVIAEIAATGGNPSSQHGSGRDAKVAVEKARNVIAQYLHAHDSEIIFTSGATESNNAVIQGIVRRENLAGKTPHIIASPTEHPSVVEPIQFFVSRGLATVTWAAIDARGLWDVDAVLGAVRPETALATFMWVNNELGTIYPAFALAERLRQDRPDIHVHIDAVQALGRLTFPATLASVGSLCLSPHKAGAFKGLGITYLRGGSQLDPLLLGGGQERARRPGTENVPGILSARCLFEALRPSDDRTLQRALLEGLRTIPGCVIHGDPNASLAQTLNFHIEGMSGDSLLMNLDLAGIEASSGAACSSGAGRPSHVLKALGLPDSAALNSVRLSWNEALSAEDAERILTTIRKTVARRASR